jgi:ribonuclease-3
VKNFSKIEKKLNLNFENKDLLTKAFTHRSYLNENPSFHLSHNERLEFLGDAVLELVITKFLYLRYPNKPEGMLTNWRASLVNTKILAKIAHKLNFHKFLLVSRGEEKEINNEKAAILADTFEAFIGALYLDQDYKACKDFIEKHLVQELPEIIEKGLYKDSKSKFQEKAQEIVGITPHYQILDEKGPDHRKIFTLGVFLEDNLIAKGKGTSKQRAEEMAAKKALQIKKW